MHPSSGALTQTTLVHHFITFRPPSSTSTASHLLRPSIFSLIISQSQLIKPAFRQNSISSSRVLYILILCPCLETRTTSSHWSFSACLLLRPDLSEARNLPTSESREPSNSRNFDPRSVRAYPRGWYPARREPPRGTVDTDDDGEALDTDKSEGLGFAPTAVVEERRRPSNREWAKTGAILIVAFLCRKWI